jgi:hypothetical protein
MLLRCQNHTAFFLFIVLSVNTEALEWSEIREDTNSHGIYREGAVGKVEKGSTAKEDTQPNFANFFSITKTCEYFAGIETEPGNLTSPT